jgi:uncharacterized protein (TIGR03067 family)
MIELRLLLVSICMASFCCTGSAAPVGNSLLGKWQGLRFDSEKPGDLVSEIARLTVEITKNEIRPVPAAQFAGVLTYTANQTASPPSIDLTVKDGEGSLTFLGIYQICDKELVMLFSGSGKPRPTDFRFGPTQKKEGMFQISWKRITETKK